MIKFKLKMEPSCPAVNITPQETEVHLQEDAKKAEQLTIWKVKTSATSLLSGLHFAFTGSCACLQHFLHTNTQFKSSVCTHQQQNGYDSVYLRLFSFLCFIASFLFFIRADVICVSKQVPHGGCTDVTTNNKIRPHYFGHISHSC